MNRVNVAIFLTAIGLIGAAPILLVGIYIARRRSDRERFARTTSKSRVWIVAGLTAVLVLVGGVVAWTISDPGTASGTAAGIDGMGGMEGMSGDAATGSASAIPMEIADQPMSAYVEGSEAIEGVVRLHGSSFTITDAQIATYGDGLVTIWRSGTPDAATATSQIEQMRDAITGGTSPFEDPRLVPARTVVYASSGMGQEHYFFAKGASVWWVAVAPSLASRVLPEALAVST